MSFAPISIGSIVVVVVAARCRADDGDATECAAPDHEITTRFAVAVGAADGFADGVGVAGDG